MNSETHSDLDIQFQEALAANIDPMPESEVLALRRRENFIAKHPEIQRRDLPIVSRDFWDYYNSGGKELLRESGLVIKRSETGEYFLHLKQCTPYAERKALVDTFLETFSPVCDLCGSEVVLQVKVCRNDTKQYRLRCEHWFRNYRERGYCRRGSGEDPLKYEVVDYLVAEYKISLVNQKGEHIDE